MIPVCPSMLVGQWWALWCSPLTCSSVVNFACCATLKSLHCFSELILKDAGLTLSLKKLLLICLYPIDAHAKHTHMNTRSLIPIAFISLIFSGCSSVSNHTQASEVHFMSDAAGVCHQLGNQFGSSGMQACTSELRSVFQNGKNSMAERFIDYAFANRCIEAKLMRKYMAEGNNEKRFLANGLLAACDKKDFEAKQYFRLAALEGSSIAAEILIKLGEQPPQPKTTVIVREQPRTPNNQPIIVQQPQQSRVDKDACYQDGGVKNCPNHPTRPLPLKPVY